MPNLDRNRGLETGKITNFGAAPARLISGWHYDVLRVVCLRMSAVAIPLLTADEYLEIERAAEFRSEFQDGVMHAMAVSPFRHSKVKINLTASVGLRLRGQRCQPFDSDLRLQIDATGLYTYPDLSIVCGPLEFGDDKGDCLTNPTVIFEVLSPSTSAYDRGKKFWNYRQLPSLRDYILLSTEDFTVEHFTRHGADQWLLTTYVGLDSLLRIDSVGIEIPLSEIYDSITSIPER